MSIAGARERTCAGTMAQVLRTFARRHGMDRAQLAAWLEIVPAQLEALAARERPALEDVRYPEQVRALAECAGCDPFLLRTILRYGA